MTDLPPYFDIEGAPPTSRFSSGEAARRADEVLNSGGRMKIQSAQCAKGIPSTREFTRIALRFRNLL